MGDGAREAEQPGTEGAEMDRVVVAGDARVAAADVGRRLPTGHLVQLQGGLRFALDGCPVQFQGAAEDPAVALPERTELVV
jgi:hypothetical protein